MKRNNKVLTFFTIIILLILCFAAFLPIFGVNTYIVKSSSMEPDINTGSLIFVEKINNNELFYKIHVGDDITYKMSNDTIVTHRITAINEVNDQIITKGINKINNSEIINSSMVVGKVFFVIPFAGYIVNYYVIFFIILVIIIIYIGVSLKKEFTKSK